MLLVTNEDLRDAGYFWMVMIQDQKFIVDRFPYEDYLEVNLGTVPESIEWPDSWEIDLSEGFSSCWPFITFKGIPKFAEYDGVPDDNQIYQQSFQILFDAVDWKYLIKL